MRLLLIVFPETYEEEIISLLERCGIHAWTEIQHLHGAGEAGKVFGDRIWPGENSALMAVIPEQMADQVVAELKGYHDRQEATFRHPFGMRVFSMACEQLV